MNLIKTTMLGILAVAAAEIQGASSVTTTSQWTGTAGTTPATAGDWSLPGNWNNGVPNGTTFCADISTLPSGAFVNFGDAATVGKLKGKTCNLFNAYTGGYLIGGTLTFDNSGYDYNITGGALYCDVSVAEGQDDGFLDQTTLAGRIRFRDRKFIYASGLSYHRLDLYATSSAELRTDDVEADELYFGSGACVTVGPRANAAHSETWTVTPGSPFVSRATDGVAKASGAIVTADAFPAGTFVKRIFSNRLMELSNPASGDGAAADQTLAFAAHAPRTVITIPRLRLVSVGQYLFRSYVKPAGAGDFRVEVMKLLSFPSQGIFFNTHNTLNTTTYEPATVVIHDAAPGNYDNSYPERIILPLSACHYEFAETGREGAMSGVPAGAATTFGGEPSYVSTLTVTNGIYASIGIVTNFVSTIVKDGAGTLALGLTNDVARNTGRIEIREGTIELPAGAWVKAVSVAAGATLKIHGDFAPTTFSAETGAKIEGEGTLLVPDAATAAALVCSENIALKFQQSMEKPIRDPVFEVVGHPAFWVDATNRATMTFQNDDGVNVTRLNDVRKTSADDGYLFATNVVYCPTMMQIGGVDRGIYFPRRNDSTYDVREVQELVWSQPITNMCAIFQVVDVRGGGGQFLGSSERLHRLLGRINDFQRDVSAGWSNDVFYRGNGTVQQKAVLDGEFLINGDLRVKPCGYLHQGGGYSIGGNTETFAPQVCEVVPTLPVAADTFSFDWGNGVVKGRNGTKLFCELIVYTNWLTRAERVKIAGYLTKKWVGCEVSYTERGADAFEEVDVAQTPSLVADAGSVVTVGKIAGTGTMVKKGTGELFVDGLAANGTVGLSVEGGTVELHTASTLPTSIADLPAGAWCHMDASDTTKYTYNATSKAMTSGWTSSVGSLTWDANNRFGTITNHPSCGLAMIDLGEPRYHSSDNSGRAFAFTRNNNIRTMFLVEDATQGGTSLFGNSVTYSYEGAMRGNWKTRWFDNKPPQCFLPSDPLISTEFNFGVSDAWKASRIRLNGERVNPTTTGFTGNGVIDIVSAVGYNRMSTDRFAYNNGHGQYLGGGLVGEYILYERALSAREVRKVEAYLANKWGKAVPAEFVQTEAGAVRLANGATLKLTGETALKVSSLGGAGAIQGDVEFGNAFVAVVNANGTVGTLDVTGSVVSAGGTVTFGGELAALRPGSYCILNATTANLGTWTLVPPAGQETRFAYRLDVDSKGLLLIVARKGTTLILR